MQSVLRERVLRNRLALTSHLLAELGFGQNPENSFVAAFLKPQNGEYIFTAVNEVFVRNNGGKGPLMKVRERQSLVVRHGPQTKTHTVFIQEKKDDNVWLTTYEATDE